MIATEGKHCEHLILFLCLRCATLLDSSHSAVQFVASTRPDVINFVLNTSYIIPEVSFYLKRLALSFAAPVFGDLVRSPPSEAVHPLHRPALGPGHHFWVQVLQLRRDPAEVFARTRLGHFFPVVALSNRSASFSDGRT